MSYSIFRWIHIVLTGIITVPVTLFMASGAIGENVENELFPDPSFLILIVVWLAGAVLMFFNRTKVIGMILTVLPSIFYVTVIIYFLIIPALTF
ncbi:hypothetical protein JMA_05120 [Jeotgalibacillus malaysiensis]|uniref:Uncharacterized protein n=1 Tax=Jeotgalibacillus malaysiensis TaxID=1508404 RepID=A0A0B5AP73_9BACL|nr:hypothetical protein [Jeotgalibacillus malaysiensis]AJD89829.1 hypothetical protein JMA_05120 [Jeotgalibacillus malaysiensis]